MHLAFTEIATTARAALQVAAAAGGYDHLDATVPERLRPSLPHRHRPDTLPGQLLDAGQGGRSVALRPDRTGRG